MAADLADDGGPPDLRPASNIGAWCNPAESGTDGENPACTGDARCLTMDSPPQNGICVVFGCSIDLTGTEGISEETCRIMYGDDFVCVDVDGVFADDGEPYDPPEHPRGQNANLDDNVCVPKCVPRVDGNDCQAEFACRPDSTRFNFIDAVCLGLACGSDDDCPEGSECNLDNGLCRRTAGDPTASIADPCEVDDDCPVGGACLLEEGRTDTQGAAYRAPRAGYCTLLGCRFAETLPHAACPAGTACYHYFFAGACMRNCDPTDPLGCRGNDCNPGPGPTQGCDWFGDYECLDWGGWSFFGGAVPVVAGPDGEICDYNVNRGCQGVPTCEPPSTCVDPETGLPDPQGVCLDSTGSGPPCTTFGNGALCDGYCVDRDTDPNNCGTCGFVCTAGTPDCVGGICQ
jgi:hypothetical protein